MHKVRPLVDPLMLDGSQIEDLAEGAFGFVQRARNKETGKEVAIKFLPRGATVNKHVGKSSLNLDLYSVGLPQKNGASTNPRGQGICFLDQPS
jgi:hypothetical protein